MAKRTLAHAFNQAKRWHEDPEYRKNRLEQQRKYREKNIKKIRKRYKKYEEELSKFKNHRCKLCDKLLYYGAKGNYCRECLYSNIKILWLKIK